jgi:hypothetical protein
VKGYIKLTDLRGLSLYVNISKIVAIGESCHEGNYLKTNLWLGPGDEDYFCCRESVEFIIERINND